jgi:hypothetical protein
MHVADEGENILIILVYVDDIAIFGALSHVLAFKKDFATRYTITDEGEIKQFLGLHIQRDRKGHTISIDQTHYIHSILNKHHVTTAHSTYTPIVKRLEPNLEPDTENELRSTYQSIVGSIMFAMLGSRPDICYATNALARHMANPTRDHLFAAQRVLSYLKTTADTKLVYGTTDDTELFAFSDSDWANDREDRKSISGYVLILNGAAIAWATRKQRSTALSTAEAEYISLSEAARQVKWTLSLLAQLEYHSSTPITLFSDSEGASSIASATVDHKRTKHIDIDYHFVRHHVLNGLLDIEYVPSQDNPADAFTKPLARPVFERFMELIGLEFSDSF